MLLSQLADGLKYSGEFVDTDVTSVVIDSRKVVPGSVFVCIEGRTFDSHTVAQKALDSGAAAVVTSHQLGLKNEIVVSDTRVANALMCQNFFGNPQKKLQLIAVTGTNGKTTVTTLIKQAIEIMGEKAGLIGTIRCEIGDMIIPAKFTTPEPWDLNALFAQMVEAGCSYAVLEASSQALDQQRLACQRFDAAVFTNLSQDHLDYHGTLEEYYKAKRILFGMTDNAIINADDDYGCRLSEEIEAPVTMFSVNGNNSDYYADDVHYSVDSVGFNIAGDGFVQKTSLCMPGKYSVSNAMAVLCTLFALGFDRAQSCSALQKVNGVSGRTEVLHGGKKIVICDFAHTADALENVLSSIKPFVKGKFIVLFGCAGDRDRTKRPDMARAVCRYADAIILSSDNPRTEDPLLIIDQIKPILQSSGILFRAEPDRLVAIRMALSMLGDDDVLILCGKGHEDYQVIDGYTIYLDEHRIVSDYFNSEV